MDEKLAKPPSPVVPAPGAAAPGAAAVVLFPEASCVSSAEPAGVGATGSAAPVVYIVFAPTVVASRSGVGVAAAEFVVASGYSVCVPAVAPVVASGRVLV